MYRIFANQFRCITAEKMRTFVPKVTISGPHQTFLWTKCNNQGRIYQNMAQYLLEAPPSNGEAFLVFTYIWQKDVEKISKVSSAMRNVNPTRTITWLVGVTTCCTIFKRQSIYMVNYTSPVFPWQTSFEKKIARENAHYTTVIIEFELRGPGPPGRLYTPRIVYF